MKVRILQAFFLFLWSSNLYSDDLVPIGKRVYRLGGAKDLTAISKNSSGRMDDFSMRDPTLSINIPTDLRKVKKKKEPKLLKKKHAILNFQMKRIVGNLTDPRVSFEIENLSLSRSDESFPINHVENIVESNRRLELRFE